MNPTCPPRLLVLNVLLQPQPPNLHTPPPRSSHTTTLPSLSHPSKPRSSSRIPSHNPQPTHNRHAHQPAHAPQRRKLTVILQEYIHDRERHTARHISYAQHIQRLRGHARRSCGRDAARVQAECLEGVGGGGFGALDAEEGL